MAITIDFLANERDLVRGADKSSDALEKISDALDDVARDSQRSAGKMESEYKDAARGVDQSNERLERSFKELASAGKQTGTKLGDDLDVGTRKGTESAGRSVEEFSSEAKQNIAETFSSFRGDASDFAQIVQDTLGGLAGSLEGLPAIAAVAAGAAGLGLILGAIEQGEADGEAFRAKVGEISQALIDAGGTGQLALTYISDKLQTLATDGDDAGRTLGSLKKLADGSGMSFDQLTQAYVGNKDALKAQIQAAKDTITAYEQMAAQAGDNTSQLDGDLNKRYLWAQETVRTLESVQKATDEAAKNEQLWLESPGPAMQRKADQLASIDQAYDDAAGAAEDYVDAESGIFDVQKYIDAMTAKAAALDAYKDNFATAALTLSPEAQAFIQSQGEESAAQFTAAYVAAGPDQQQKLNAIWTTAGKTSADSYANSIKSNLPPTVAGPTVVINDVDTSRVIGQISQTLAGHTFKVNALATVRVGNAVN